MLCRTALIAVLALPLISSSAHALGFNKQPTGVEWKLDSDTLSGARGQTLTLKLHGSFPRGWHTYSTRVVEGLQPTELKIAPEKFFKAGSPIGGTRPKSKHDDLLNLDVEYFDEPFTLEIPVSVPADVNPGDHDATLTVTSQLCNEKNCLLPQDMDFSFKVKVSDAPVVVDINAKTNEAPVTPPKEAAKPEDDFDDFNAAQKRGVFAYLWVAMIAGAIALVTPCVFPMVPITISFFTKRKQVSRARSLRDAAIFSLGIIVTFSGLGLFFSLVYGASSIQDFATDPYVNLIIAAVFVALALSLFGVFEIQVPLFIMNKLNAKANEGDGIGSVLLMGLVFALTSFTCTGPFVGAVLVQASQGNWIWPLIGMLGFSSVFAAPFFLLALFPALLKSLPKSGGWLNSVKVVMGFLEVAAAMKFVSNADLVWQWGIFTREFFLSGWVALAVLITFYLLGRFQLTHDTPVEKIGGVRVLFASGFLTLGVWLGTGLMGSNLGELDSFIPPRIYPGDEGNPRNGPGGGKAKDELTWLPTFEEGLAKAKEEGKPLFVDFTGFT